MKRLLIPLVAVVLLAGTGAWLMFMRAGPAAVETPLAELAPPPTEPAVEQFPLAPAEPSPPLPSLDGSDSAVGDALAALSSGAVEQLLNGTGLARKFVATVDALPRPKLAVEVRPLRAAAGTFVIDGDENSATIAAGNYQRYDALMSVVRKVSIDDAVAIYRRYYPLLQQAYQELGYPDGHFNDRMVTVIDHLLATPTVAGPIRLVRPKVFYEYADRNLEHLSAGQKWLIRLGPAHGALLRQRLGELRAAITAAR